MSTPAAPAPGVMCEVMLMAGGASGPGPAPAPPLSSWPEVQTRGLHRASTHTIRQKIGKVVQPMRRAGRPPEPESGTGGDRDRERDAGRLLEMDKAAGLEAVSWEGYHGCHHGGFAALERCVRRSVLWTPDWVSGPLLRRHTRGAGRESGAGSAFRGGLVGGAP